MDGLADCGCFKASKLTLKSRDSASTESLCASSLHFGMRLLHPEIMLLHPVFSAPPNLPPIDPKALVHIPTNLSPCSPTPLSSCRHGSAARASQNRGKQAGSCVINLQATPYSFLTAHRVQAALSQIESLINIVVFDVGVAHPCDFRLWLFCLRHASCQSKVVRDLRRLRLMKLL